MFRCPFGVITLSLFVNRQLTLYIYYGWQPRFVGFRPVLLQFVRRRVCARVFGVVHRDILGAIGCLFFCCSVGVIF